MVACSHVLADSTTFETQPFPGKGVSGLNGSEQLATGQRLRRQREAAAGSAEWGDPAHTTGEHALGARAATAQF